MNSISTEEFKKYLVQKISVLDVRAPIEFSAGSIPGSINSPLLNDSERHLIGLCYQEKGQQAAIDLGYKIVSGENLKKKMLAWTTILEKNPNMYITCFRGGLRSQSVQKFLSDQGIHVLRLKEGYKSARNLFLEHLNTDALKRSVVILSGTTGSGKTHLLNDVADFYPAIDLEGLAHHRGSAFGAWDQPQPSQADFENRLSLQTMQMSQQPFSKPLLLEDESRMIGACHIPEPFFLKMREASIILVQESIQNRVEHIFFDYITSKISPKKTLFSQAQIIFSQYRKSVEKIQKKLGGVRASELINDLNICEKAYLDSQTLDKNKIWIEKLLVWYYDPLYRGSLEKRNPSIQFQGTKVEIKAYLQSLR